MRARISHIAPFLLPVALVFAAAGQQPPHGTDAQQSGDASEQDRVVIVGTVPIPDVGEGAPRFTSRDVEDIRERAEDTAIQAERDLERCTGTPRGYLRPRCDHRSFTGLLVCEKEYAIKAGNLAGKAAAATKIAEDVRGAAAAGRADSRAVEAAELNRQEAVNKMQDAREELYETQADIGVWQELLLRGRKNIELDVMAASVQRKRAKEQGRPADGLSVVGVEAALLKDGKGPHVLIQGRITNIGEGPVRVPNLTALLLDERDWVLAKQLVSPTGAPQIASGSSHDFRFTMQPVPDAMKKAVVMIASPSEPPPRYQIGAFCSRDY